MSLDTCIFYLLEFDLYFYGGFKSIEALFSRMYIVKSSCLLELIT